MCASFPMHAYLKGLKAQKPPQIPTILHRMGCSPNCADSTGLLTASLPRGHCPGHRTGQGDEDMPLWNRNEQTVMFLVRSMTRAAGATPPCLPWVLGALALQESKRSPLASKLG